MSDDEVENMSIDGAESDDSMSDGAGDETDEEDWAAIGAAELRRRASRPSIPSSSTRRNYNLLCLPGPVNNRRLSSSGSIAKPFARVAGSAPADRYNSGSYISRNTFNNHAKAVAMPLDPRSQEQEAARALLSLGSM